MFTKSILNLHIPRSVKSILDVFGSEARFMKPVESCAIDFSDYDHTISMDQKQVANTANHPPCTRSLPLCLYRHRDKIIKSEHIVVGIGRYSLQYILFEGLNLLGVFEILNDLH